MKIFIMTDMEGCAGIINHDDWVCPDARYYEDGKRLLTAEVNAAINGLVSAFRESKRDDTLYILVADGHGYGGINIELLSKHARYQRGWTGPYPFGMDNSFDAAVWIGQHPKAGTEKGHICHTGWFNTLNFTINGVSVGEFGQMVYMADELGVTPIFASGCRAFTEEACALVDGIGIAAVKEGILPGKGDELDCDAYRARNLAAIHLQPESARDLIEAGAKDALLRFMRKDRFKIVPKICAPYICTAFYRQNSNIPPHIDKYEHPTSLIACMNMPYGK